MSFEPLKKQFPTHERELEKIVRMRAVLDDSLPTFFEPISFISLEEGKKNDDKVKLVTLDAAIISSWVNHIGSGTIVRMHSLEDGVLEQLSNGYFLNCMVLARAHMEAAAFAAYAENKLIECSGKNEWEPLKEIIVKMLFGTSFKLERRNEDLQEVLGWSASDPIRIGHAIEAMGHFSETLGGKSAKDIRGIYALLCEYAHPAKGGIKGFTKIQRETEAGWICSYTYDETIEETEIDMALSILLTNMRIGYANTILLLNGQFEDITDGISYRRPSIEVGETIWTLIFQQELPE